MVDGAATLTLTDGESSVRVPEAGRLVLTEHPERAPDTVEGRVVRIDLSALSNGGKRLSLVRGNRTLTTVRYTDIPAGGSALPREVATTRGDHSPRGQNRRGPGHGVRPPRRQTTTRDHPGGRPPSVIHVFVARGTWGTLAGER